MNLLPSLKCFAAVCAAGLLVTPAIAGNSTALNCYRAKDKVQCFLDKATAKLDRIQDVGERADAAAELLYTAAVVGYQDDPWLQQTQALATDPMLAPYREMTLLYAIDLYYFSLESPLADTSFAAAAARFETLENSLHGHDLLNLYIGVCSMLTWEEDFLGRWGEFLSDNCNEEKLQSLDLDSGYDRAWLLAMMPVASTVAGDRDGYVRNAGSELAWLERARLSAAHSKIPGVRNFVNAMGAVMQSLNAASLEIFEQPDRAKSALDQSLKYLRNLEHQGGISGTTTPLRRTLAEALYKAGRDKEAKTLIQQMLKRVDGDPKGKTIPLAEQVAILALAANLVDFVESGGANPAPQAETREL